MTAMDSVRKKLVLVEHSYAAIIGSGDYNSVKLLVRFNQSTPDLTYAVCFGANQSKLDERSGRKGREQVLC